MNWCVILLTGFYGGEYSNVEVIEYEPILADENDDHDDGDFLVHHPLVMRTKRSIVETIIAVTMMASMRMAVMSMAVMRKAVREGWSRRRED